MRSLNFGLHHKQVDCGQIPFGCSGYCICCPKRKTFEDHHQPFKRTFLVLFSRFAFLEAIESNTTSYWLKHTFLASQKLSNFKICKILKKKDNKRSVNTDSDLHVCLTVLSITEAEVLVNRTEKLSETDIEKKGQLFPEFER